MVGGKKQKKEAENSRGVRKPSQIPIKARKEPNQLYISSTHPNSRKTRGSSVLTVLPPPSPCQCGGPGSECRGPAERTGGGGGEGGHRGKADSSSSPSPQNKALPEEQKVENSGQARPGPSKKTQPTRTNSGLSHYDPLQENPLFTNPQCMQSWRGKSRPLHEDTHLVIRRQ